LMLFLLGSSVVWFTCVPEALPCGYACFSSAFRLANGRIVGLGASSLESIWSCMPEGARMKR
jgi:hypothetical protein